MDFIDGEITHEEAIKQAKTRIAESDYYGISAYVGKNVELMDLYDQ